jgi:hypothetical protein
MASTRQQSRVLGLDNDNSPRAHSTFSMTSQVEPKTYCNLPKTAKRVGMRLILDLSRVGGYDCGK